MNMNLETIIFNDIKGVINSWDSDTTSEIYAISFFIYNNEDDPRKPTLTLGYNTETCYSDSIDGASDKEEARWNYAFWMQNQELLFGEDEVTSELVKQWIEEGFDSDNNDTFFQFGEEITEKFVSICIAVSRKLHTEDVIKNKFGKDIPIIIHELEYYDVIAKQTVEANPPHIADEFAEWIYSMYK